MLAAADAGQAARVAQLLEAGAGLLECDRNGRTALHLAARGGHARVVRLLLEAGADVNGLSARLKRSPLHWAAAAGHAKVVPLLVEAGADLERPDRNSQTPLVVAARCNHASVTDALLLAGARTVDRDFVARRARVVFTVRERVCWAALALRAALLPPRLVRCVGEWL